MSESPSGAIEHLSPDAPVEEVVAIYQRDRAVIIDDLIEPEVLQSVKDEIDEPLKSWTSREDDFLGFNTKRLVGIVKRLPSTHPLLENPLVLSLLEQVIGTLHHVQLNSTQIIAVGPGETRQNLHRDRWPWAVLPLPKDFEYLVNCMWALTDFDAENGATHLVPGSLELPDPTRTMDIIEKEDGATLPDGRPLHSLHTVRAEMKAGSVLLWSGSLYHGGGANQTNDFRIGLSVTYTHAVLRQEENQFLICPPEDAKKLPETLRKLIGYSLANYALGYVDDMDGPETLLR